MGEKGYRLRQKDRGKNAVLVTSGAMPAVMDRFFTGAPRALHVIAETMGARLIALLLAGLSARKQTPVVPERMLRKARAAGRMLAAS